ncbi:MAG: hypothetical protein CHACPFDD_01145 [Phycisphaerae bacterium]|nr:hypothetical protein [Phycisphaerae bacterium]
MIPGSVRSFHHYRRLALLAAVAAPLLAVAGAWWLVDRVVLAPPRPRGDSPADACVRFIVDPRGLPRLSAADAERCVLDQIRRAGHDAAFREQFLTVLRRSTSDEQNLFVRHLIAALKPMVMRDVDAFVGTPPAGRDAFLDDRIVAYNRLRASFGDVRINKSMLAGALPTSPTDLLQLLNESTSADERSRATSYLAALAERIAVILADDALRATIERRIAAPE